MKVRFLEYGEIVRGDDLIMLFSGATFVQPNGETTRCTAAEWCAWYGVGFFGPPGFLVGTPWRKIPADQTGEPAVCRRIEPDDRANETHEEKKRKATV